MKPWLILGNGPSMALAIGRDLSKYVVLGINRAYQAVKCDYLIFIDREIVEMHGEDLVSLDCPVWCPEEFAIAPRCPVPDKFHRLKRNMQPQNALGESWQEGLYFSGCQPMAAVNFAYLMGAREIVLLGVDLLSDDRWDGSKSTSCYFNHMIIPDLETAANHMKSKGIRCLNASPASAVVGWEMTELDGRQTQKNNGSCS